MQILAIECSGDLLWENSFGANPREEMLGVTGIKYMVSAVILGIYVKCHCIPRQRMCLIDKS